MNVLLITVDDLRPQLGAYEGQDFPASLQVKMHTPYIDALAAKSLLLKRAYVQVALCSPSRTCLLTGRRPHTTNVFHIGPYFREVGGNFTTIPQYFKINGYSTIGIGKVFHGGSSSAGNDPISWTEPHLDGVSHFENSGRSWSAVPDEQLKVKPLVDQQIADKTIKTLRKFAPKALSGKKPFFVAIGLNKPHLPFVFPKSFMKHYPDVELPENPYAPVNMPSIANYRCSRLYKDVNATRKDEHKNKALSDSYVVNLRRAYYSCVSYIDSLVGRILSELDTLGLSNRTIVSLWGDHGFQLGEHGMWCKHVRFTYFNNTDRFFS
ncbi:hypothetical protein DPMN_159306 [Dreissena polymorpha]|uniref:Sulfatase N-terminal domain-containing protein n=1 Tax=Dreissena polymorpha TaxID=45954 RepID=A0A9D4IMS2_DREPO|nr:hypothetical protein DPMN_159306 [Dreissena polymorpha]